MLRFRRALLTTTALVPLGIMPAAANPLGSNVVAGSASVSGQGTAAVTVTQQSDKAIINWNTFNIAPNERTRFVQPSSSSVTLNRVTGGLGPSEIYGSLSANGRLFLVNPDGILIGPGAKIDTAGFLATTHDIKNNDFMAGRYSFGIAGRPNASVVNLGNITAANQGFAALVAPGVRNSGTITATLGKVSLASGNGFTLDFYGDKLITLGLGDQVAAQVKDVATGQTLDALVKNDGTIKTKGGRIELTAAAARQVVDAVINTSGVVEANSVRQQQGTIVIEAATSGAKPAGAPTQNVKVSGKLSAAGKTRVSKGGTIAITGEAVAVAGAKIDASGRAGGGTVLVGGDWAGGHPKTPLPGVKRAALELFPVPTATNVSIDAGTQIDASAGRKSDGGKVIIWADDTTAFSGSIAARGGAQSGDGGFIEVSGKQFLGFYGAIDSSAPAGLPGTILFDPRNVTISTGPTSGGTLSPTDFDPTANDSILNALSLTTLLILNNVVVSTGATGTQSGNITVATPLTWSSGNTLTLTAANNISVNAAVTATSSGLALNAGNNISVNAAVNADNGNLTFNATNNIAINSSITGNNGALTLNAGNVISPSAAINVGVFTLQNGNWSEVTPNLSGLNAGNFQLIGGTFLRALGGNGTASSPYLVTDIYGLQGIASAGLLNKNFALANNVDASQTANWSTAPIPGVVFGGQGFIPIGTLSTPINFSFNGVNYNFPAAPFLGSFDGRGYAINNLFVVGGWGRTGLFGSVGTTGLLKNVALTNANVSNGGIIFALDSKTGALAGENLGTISSSRSSGTVTSGMGFLSGFTGGLVGHNEGSITLSSSSATVTGQYAGGLVGTNAGQISHSNASGQVNGYAPFTFAIPGGGNGYFFSHIGGLVGVNTGSIRSAFATGFVRNTFNNTTGELFGISVGGLVGGNSGSIANTYSNGNFWIVTGGANSNVGGLVGANAQSGTITTSYVVERFVVGGAGSRTGGVVGYQDANSSTTSSYWNAFTTNQATDGAPSGTSNISRVDLRSALPSGFSSSAWAINPGINSGFPYLLPPSNTSGGTTVTLPVGFNPFQSQQVIDLIKPDWKIAGSTPPVISNTSVSNQNSAANNQGSDQNKPSAQTPSAGSVKILDQPAAQAFAEQYSAPLISKSADAAGYMYPPNTPVDLKGECVSLVKVVAPNVGPTSGWSQGISVGPDNPTLAPGTPIATFKEGTYPSDGIMNPEATGLSKYAHAAIFIDYVRDSQNKIVGMYVLEQYAGRPAGIDFKSFPTGYQYSVVK